MSALSPDQWQALSPHLDEALGMTDEERSIWLSSLRDSESGRWRSNWKCCSASTAPCPRKAFSKSDSIGLPRESGLAGQTLGATP